MSNGTAARVVRTPGISDPPITPERWRRWLENKRQASNRMNWSDGGHWIGSGREPDAYDTVTARSASTLILLFPSEDCVEKFRDQSDAIAQRLGYGYGLLFAYIFRNHWVRGAVAGLVTAFLINNAEGLRVRSGWSYRIDSSLTVTLSAHPWGRKQMITESTQTLYNQNNQVVRTRNNRHEHNLSSESDDRLYQLMRAVGNNRDGTTRITCPDANVLLHN